MPNPHPLHQALVLWIIWFAMLVSVFIFQFILGGGIPSGPDDGQPNTAILVLSIAVILIATMIRWFVIPRQTEADKLLVVMIVGIAFAESAQFFQLFLIGDAYPRTQLTLFVFSVLGIAQFAPVYAGKLRPGYRSNAGNQFQHR